MPLSSVSVSRTAGAKQKIAEARDQLAGAMRRANDLGLDLAGRTATPDKIQKFGKPSPKVVSRMTAAVAAANFVDSLGRPYVWGGGHVAGDIDPSGGLDCSGAVSYIAQKLGLLNGSLVSGDMGQITKPGPGAITVFYNPTHTFMKIGNKYFGTSTTNPGGGAGWIDRATGESEANSGKYQVGHFPGMGQKVALQLGIKGGGANSFPGMNLSADGTMAQVTDGTQVGDPGFSQKPILAGAGDYAGGIDSGGLTDFYDLILNAGGESEPGSTGLLDEFITGRARPRKPR
jgi:hypothetical protein